MNAARLALLPHGMSLADAVNELESSGHGACLVQFEHELRLITVEQALEHLHSAPVNTPVGSVPQWLWRRVDAPARPRKSTAGDVSERAAAPIVAPASRLQILEFAPGKALVSSPDQDIHRLFGLQLKFCRCRVHPRSHVFLPSDLDANGQCPLDQSAVDC